MDHQKLIECTRRTVDYVTNHQLPTLEYARNHKGEDDVAIFDFSARHEAKFSCYVKDRRRHKLFLVIVGDTLLEVCNYYIYFCSKLS